jgi:hypothetical protein
MVGSIVTYTGGETLEVSIHGAAFRELNVGASVKISDVTVLYQLQMLVSVIRYGRLLGCSELNGRRRKGPWPISRHYLAFVWMGR